MESYWDEMMNYFATCSFMGIENWENILSSIVEA